MTHGGMHFLSYCRLVFWIAARHAISRAQFVIALISFITGAAIWLAPVFGMTIDTSGLMAMLHSPAFYAILVASVFLFNLIYAQYLAWVDEHTARIKAEGDFSDDIRMNIDLKIRALSVTAKSELYRLADGSIGLHQLSNEVEKELGDAALLTPKYAHDPARFNEHWTLIRQWLKQNKQC
jgi:hypothetical protein